VAHHPFRGEPDRLLIPKNRDSDMLGFMSGAFHPIITPLGDLGSVFDDDGRLVQLIRFHGSSPPDPEGPVPKSLPFLKRQL